MKTKLSFGRTTCAASLLLLALPAAVLAEDYTWTTNNGATTITGYTGPGGDVAIPDTITGLPVTSTTPVRAFPKPSRSLLGHRHILVPVKGASAVLPV